MTFDLSGEFLDYSPCPCCQSDSRHPAYSFPQATIVRCNSCGIYYLFPRLSEEVIFHHYRGNYFESNGLGYKNYTEQQSTLRATFRRLMFDLKKRNLTGGALLEVGCAYGYLLEQAEGFFEKRVGTDYSRLAVEEACKRADRVYEGGIDKLSTDNRFDCIIAVHVIEHIYNPGEFVRKLRDHLNPGGSLVLATPDVGSLWRILMGRRWPFFKIPEHVCYFDSKSLSGLMSQFGFAKIHSLPFSQSFPLTLIASKLNIRLPAAFSKLSLWLPATTTAIYGVFCNDKDNDL